MAAKLSQQADVNNNVDATITLCSEPNQVGKCTSVLVQFTIPAAMPPPPGPPLAPVPDNLAVQVNFSNIHQCDNQPKATYEIVNNGNIDINSIDIELTNLATLTALGHTYGDGMFVSAKNGCTRTQAPIEAGTNGFVTAILDTEKVSIGQQVEAKMKLCSDKGLAGICSTVLVQFTYK
jgi:hypothetical protein